MATLYSVIESFILHTNQHTCAFSALCASLPIFGTKSILLKHFLFYNEVFFHSLYKSDIYQVSLNIDKKLAEPSFLLVNKSHPALPYSTPTYLPYLIYPVLSCPVLSCPVLSYPILSYPILSCPILSYPTLS
jgi:hypothetical protein